MLKSRALSFEPFSEAQSGAAIALRAQNVAMNPARLLSMAETVGNMGHWHWYPDTDVMAWSDQIWALVGLARNEHRACLDLALAHTHADDRAEVQRQLRKAADEGVGFEFDLRVVRSDGAVRTVIAKGQPEFRNGKLDAMFGVLTDVTEAFAAIHSIREQHEMLDLAAELAQLGHWVWNCDEQAVSFCSDALARIHDMPIETMRDRFRQPDDFAAAVVPEERDGYLRTIRDALATAEPYAIEYRLATATGEIKVIREIGHPLFDDHEMKRFVGAVQDITEAKRRENEIQVAKAALERQAEALRRSENRFRDIIESSVQGIAIVRDRRPVFVNQAYARMLGLKSTEEVAALNSLRDVLAPDDSHPNTWDEAMSGQLDGKLRRAALRTTDGRTLWTDSVGRLIEWEGAPAFLVTVIDVTERHRGEQELQAKARELEELNLQKDKLFSIIAHDLKGPFNSVIGFADLLAVRAAVLTPEQIADYARIVRDSAISVHGLFDNLLTWAAFQLRDAAPRFANVDLAAAVDESVAPLLSLAAEKGVRIVNAIAEKAPGVHVLADEDLLRIVVRNLVSNGIKFCHSDGEVRIDAATDRAGERMVRMTIRDTGVGMEADDVANLFRLDRAVSMPGTRGERGTGLGLYLCRDIVTRHGGRISAEATPAKGSAFHITLPQAFPKASA